MSYNVRAPEKTVQYPLFIDDLVMRNKDYGTGSLRGFLHISDEGITADLVIAF